jgi:hypothetical protein
MDDVTRSPQERTVYVVDARLVKFRAEAGKKGDSDFHLVISDDTLQFSSPTAISPHSFVAEVVDPTCVPGRLGNVPMRRRFQAHLTSVRDRFVQQFPNIDMTGGWNETNGLSVRLPGVGFFDRDHSQIGRQQS